MIGGGNRFYLKFWVKLIALERNRRFSIYFSRSASAVSPTEKSSIITNRKSTYAFPMSPRGTSYVVPKPPPPKGAQKSKVSKIWTISCGNSKWYDIGYQLLLITNRKSHTGFSLVPISMTLNDLERRNSPYFAFLHNSIAFQADYVTVVEDWPIMFVKYCLPFPVFHVWPKLTRHAARSICNSRATCF